MGGYAASHAFPRHIMIPVIAKIDPVGAIRASEMSSRKAGVEAQSHASERRGTTTTKALGTRSAPVANNSGIRLTVKPDTHEVIATLVNTQTNEVIRQIPGEETGRAGEVIRAIAGQLLDQHA